MISLRYRPGQGIELANRQATLICNGPTIKFNDQTFSEPGEYELEGIEIIYGTTSALIAWEGLQITYIFQASKPTPFEKTQFAPSGVMIFASNLESLAKAEFNEILETFDANTVVFTTATKLDQQLVDTLKLQTTNQIKLNSQNLPVEGRDFYLLES